MEKGRETKGGTVVKVGRMDRSEETEGKRNKEPKTAKTANSVRKKKKGTEIMRQREGKRERRQEKEK